MGDLSFRDGSCYNSAFQKAEKVMKDQLHFIETLLP